MLNQPGGFPSFNVPDGARKRDIEPRIRGGKVPAGAKALRKSGKGKVTRPRGK